MNTNKSEPYKFYAPVQIIAPTVYFNSPKNTTNNVVVKVNEYSGKTNPNNPEAKIQYSQNESLLKQMTSKGISSCSAINTGKQN